MKLLDDICEIRSGYPFRERPERVATGGVQMVQMRDIDGATGWVNGTLEQIATPPNWQHHRLHVGDLVMAARGERNEVGQFAGEGDAVVASNLLVLRPLLPDRIIPDYLVWYLNLPARQEKFQKYRAGSGIPFLPIEALRQLPIHVPTIEMQKHLLHLHQLSVEEQRLMTQIQEKRRKLMTGVMQCLLTGQTRV